ncbi:MAG: HIRAN domain-containing protein [Clostridium sp.]|uniref:HIRAN domain-containing protein n=1 Tax=Clostridium sp. TaxID=1506 RepID=UPI003F325AED
MFKFLLNLLTNETNSTKPMKNNIPKREIQNSKNTIHTKVAGVTFNNRQSLIRNCYPNQELKLIREKNNAYDKNAIGIYHGNRHLGYVNKNLASSLAPQIDSGTHFRCYVSEVTGGNGKNYGLNIYLEY